MLTLPHFSRSCCPLGEHRLGDSRAYQLVRDDLQRPARGGDGLVWSGDESNAEINLDSYDQYADNEYLFTSESVTEGHPTRLLTRYPPTACSMLSCAMAMAVLLRDAREHRPGGGVGRQFLDHDLRPHPRRLRHETIRQVLAMSTPFFSFSADSCAVPNAIDKQTRHRLGRRPGLRMHGALLIYDELDVRGAADQGILVRYADQQSAVADAAADVPRGPLLLERLAARRAEGRTTVSAWDGKQPRSPSVTATRQAWVEFL